jgi:hypothetical protein
MQDRRHPVLDYLDALVGEWETEAKHPDLPGTKIHGRATFEWLDGRHFLIWRSSYDHPDIPNAVAVLGCGATGAADDSSPSTDAGGECAMHYFDSRGVSRVYRIAAEPGAWRFWRDRPDFSQRYVCTVSADGTRMEGRGQLSRDGATWKEDLSITFRRSAIPSGRVTP